ncbi:MAG TPA: TylF/MycF/NovP-related O-methyltransferase [Phycisphaerae bacterium]|nr:TylF/MycF/NovP-related O-methyltransferase [Phycisphaerae bacterium]
MQEAGERSEYLELLKRVLAATLYDESAWTIEGTGAGRYPKRRPWVAAAEAVRAVRRWTATAGRRVRTRVVRCDPYDAQAAEEGRRWPMFGYTMIGVKRLDHLERCMADVVERNVPGDFLEAGVWRGGATIFMRAFLKAHGIGERRVWVADSFEGLPPARGRDREMGDADLSGEAHLKVSLEQVRANFARFGLLDERVRFVKGWFHESLPAAPVERLAVLRLDGDMYSSTMDTLQALYDKVSPGGWVIVDDYPGWEGCRRATDEFRASRGITAPLEKIDWTGVCWRVAGDEGGGRR